MSECPLIYDPDDAEAEEDMRNYVSRLWAEDWDDDTEYD